MRGKRGKPEAGRLRVNAPVLEKARLFVMKDPAADGVHLKTDGVISQTLISGSGPHQGKSLYQVIRRILDGADPGCLVPGSMIRISVISNLGHVTNPINEAAMLAPGETPKITGFKVFMESAWGHLLDDDMEAFHALKRKVGWAIIKLVDKYPHWVVMATDRLAMTPRSVGSLCPRSAYVYGMSAPGTGDLSHHEKALARREFKDMWSHADGDSNPPPARIHLEQAITFREVKNAGTKGKTEGPLLEIGQSLTHLG